MNLRLAGATVRLLRRMCVLSAFVAVLSLSSAAFAQQAAPPKKNYSAAGVAKPQATTTKPGKPAKSTTKSKRGLIFRATAKFDPIPAIPAPDYIHAASTSAHSPSAQARLVGLEYGNWAGRQTGKKFYADCYFETDTDLGSEVMVACNVRQIDDDGDGQTLRQPKKNTDLVKATKVAMPKIKAYRYVVTVELTPPTNTPLAWDQKKARMHIRVKVSSGGLLGATTYVDVKTVVIP